MRYGFAPRSSISRCALILATCLVPTFGHAQIAPVTPQQVDAAMQALGISPSEALLLKEQLPSGVISPQEMQSLCFHLAASNLNPAVVPSILGTIGLNAAQFQQLSGCVPAASGGHIPQPPLGPPIGP